MQQLFRLRYIPSWPASTKFNFRIGHRNTWVSARIVRRLWKLSRPSEHLPWSISAKRRWKTSLPGMQWGYAGSLDMLEYEAFSLDTVCISNRSIVGGVATALRTRRSGVRIAGGARHFTVLQNVLTGCGAHPMCTGALYGG